MHQYGSATLAVIAETRMVEVMFVQVAERFALWITMLQRLVIPLPQDPLKKTIRPNEIDHERQT